MSTVALPIETKVRELHGKLWLGLHLLERGHDVVVGPSWEVDVTLHKTQPDTYISQGPSDSKIDQFTELREAGIRVYALPPESGIGSSTEQIVMNKKQIVNHIDGFLCFGQKFKNALSKYYKDTNSIHLTGNPRFDLQNSQFRAFYYNRAKNLRNEYGSFILLNTNFGLANAFDQDKKYKMKEKITGGIDMNNLRHGRRTFHSFLESVLYLSDSLNELNIIVRPHPGENHEIYSHTFDKFDDIKVIHSGDVREWITAAEMVMHHDCTTGIESVLLGKPTLSYRPIDAQNSDKRIPQAVSTEVFERDRLVEKIQELVSEGPKEMSNEQKEKLRPYFQNIDSCAATAICDVIEQKTPLSTKDYQQLKPSNKELIETRIRATKWSEQVAEAYDIVRKFTGEGSLKQAREKRQQKFPGLAQDEIMETLENMTGDSTPLHVIEKVSGVNDTFRLYSR